MASKLRTTEDLYRATQLKVRGQQPQSSEDLDTASLVTHSTKQFEASWKVGFAKAYTAWAVEVGKGVIKNNWWM